MLRKFNDNLHHGPLLRKIPRRVGLIFVTAVIEILRKLKFAHSHNDGPGESSAVCRAVKEVRWVQQVLAEMQVTVHTPSTIYCDNKSTIKMSENDTEHDRSKRIEIKNWFVRDEIKKKHIKLEWISTNNQIADICTNNINSNH